MVTRARLDAELVRRGLARSRQQAAELIEQGRVAVRGVPAGKPATVVDRDTPVTVRDDGRARLGLPRGAQADRRAGHVRGRRGRGPLPGRRRLHRRVHRRAARPRAPPQVVAVDVGYGQLVWRLRSDERVRVLDRTNVRTLTPADIGGPVAAHGGRSVVHLAAHGAARAGRAAPPRTASCCRWSSRSSRWAGSGSGTGGVVRDPRVAAGRAGRGRRGGPGARLALRGAVASPLPGPSGNVEYFLRLARHGADVGDRALRAAVEEGPQ